MKQNQINKSSVRTTGPFQNPENSSESIHLLAFICWSLPGTQKRLRKQYSSPRIHLTNVVFLYIILFTSDSTVILWPGSGTWEKWWEVINYYPEKHTDIELAQKEIQKWPRIFLFISKFSHLLYCLIRKSQIFFTYNNYVLQDCDRHSDVNRVPLAPGTTWWDAFAH